MPQISNRFLQHDGEFTAPKRPPQLPDLNPAEQLMWWNGSSVSQLCDVRGISEECFLGLVESLPQSMKAKDASSGH